MNKTPNIVKGLADIVLLALFLWDRSLKIVILFSSTLSLLDDFFF